MKTEVAGGEFCFLFLCMCSFFVFIYFICLHPGPRCSMRGLLWHVGSLVAGMWDLIS